MSLMLTDAPRSPVSPLQASAIAARESFVALESAGFTEDQALRVIALTIAEANRG